MEIRILGPLEVWHRDRRVPLAGPHEERLLASLALHANRTVPLPHLVEALWDGRPPETATSQVRGIAQALGRRLTEPGGPGPAPRILTLGPGYRLVADEQVVDALAFTARVEEAFLAVERSDVQSAVRLLRSALAMWRGSLPADVGQPANLLERPSGTAALEAGRLHALEQWLGLERQLGRDREVIDELRAQVVQDPLHDLFVENLVRALHHGGRRGDALDVYRRFTERLAADLGIAPSPRMRELHAVLLGGAAAPAAAAPAAAAPAAAAPAAAAPAAAAAAAASPEPSPNRPVPGQLPPDVARFAGRGELLQELLGRVVRGAAEGRLTVSLITGRGGVGKTTLAIHLGHLLRGLFPDGQLHANLAGASEHPAEPGAVLAGFLGALGVADTSIPEDTAERATLFRSAAAGLRLLVVLDNARDAAQLAPLLPAGPGCAVLVTARSALHLPEGECVPLEVLDPAEALELLAGLAGADRVAADPSASAQLVRACGLLPLAVRAAGARLAVRPAWTVAHLAQRLLDEKRRLAELAAADPAVAAVFELSYGQLDAQRARAFRLLALHDMPDISLAAAAALLDIDEARAEELLEGLVDLSLLDTRAPGRYGYHDLWRLFARGCAEREDPARERTAALCRLVDFQLASLKNANRLTDPAAGLHRTLARTHAQGLNWPDAAAARVWVEVERVGLFSVLRMLAALPDVPLRPAADLYFLAVRYSPDADVHYPALPEAVGRALSAAADSAGDDWARGRIRSALGNVLLDRFKFDEAEQLLRSAVELSTAHRDHYTTAITRTVLGMRLSWAGQHAEAARCHQLGLEINAEYLQDPVLEVVMLVGLARGCLQQQRSAESLESATRARDLAVRLQTPRWQMWATYVRGVALNQLGRYSEALTEHQDALELARSRGYVRWEGASLARLAEDHLGIGDAARAVSCAEEAQRRCRETADNLSLAVATRALGEALAELGERDRAELCRGEARRIFTRLGMPAEL
ncbi:DNA-binding SARP family transcriptional activator/tetratricopeptide (TPR) repeat protein [Kitasatospora sp. MAA4]|uniref:AfsR/SARP family transcriptional regulator n=1 Tax=Kitasatospora sp. MAA4 TaxID=3035093 RepID=UPI0024754AD4|nr:BTAD domain-containing putative transcriptional regulator [Kitasatospora sp. MAA4]MDH6132160.1 DNA-binding SARP family transcriptional activator/tetratricopeptide (TPR) repeat protein [Kitasatospora sp. MAA4]